MYAVYVLKLSIFKDANLSEKFLTEMEFCRIDPWLLLSLASGKKQELYFSGICCCQHENVGRVCHRAM
jgi:hypothetical protein